MSKRFSSEQFVIDDEGKHTPFKDAIDNHVKSQISFNGSGFGFEFPLKDLKFSTMFNDFMSARNSLAHHSGEVELKKETEDFLVGNLKNKSSLDNLEKFLQAALKTVNIRKSYCSH